MKEQTKLIQKVKHLIRKAGLPRWLHHFGPKKYEFWHHALALIIKQECKLGYRLVSRLLKWLGFKVPSYSALAKMNKRIPLPIWQRLLASTASNNINLVAIDGTCISRSLPSPYYYKRIDKPYSVEVPLKLSILVDTRTKKILSLRLRSKRANNIKDAKYLINHLPSRPKKLVADKGYDATWLHELCQNRGIKTYIPIRNYGKLKGFNARTNAAKYFKNRIYHRREMVESTFKAIKCKFGASVSSVKFSAQRAEMYCRAITHNIIYNFRGLFQHSR